jgi:hypothetical protein
LHKSILENWTIGSFLAVNSYDSISPLLCQVESIVYNRPSNLPIDINLGETLENNGDRSGRFYWFSA